MPKGIPKGKTKLTDKQIKAKQKIRNKNGRGLICK